MSLFLPYNDALEPYLLCIHICTYVCLFFSIFRNKESIALSRSSFALKSLNWEQPFAEETAASMFRERWHERNRQVDAWISYMRITAKTSRHDRQTIYGYYRRFDLQLLSYTIPRHACPPTNVPVTVQCFFLLRRRAFSFFSKTSNFCFLCLAVIFYIVRKSAHVYCLYNFLKISIKY